MVREGTKVVNPLPECGHCGYAKYIRQELPNATLLSIPLFAILLHILVSFGIGWAIIFAAIGDFTAAALLGTIDAKTGVELAIITIFVYIGIRLAPLISRIILQSSGI